MSPWLRVLEAWAVQQLLRTPGFHRAVEKVARGVHRMQHGIPPDEMGGTKIDRPGQSGFLSHFADEVTAQLRQGKIRETGGVNIDQRIMHGKEVDHKAAGPTASQTTAEDESADAVWRSTRKTAQEPPKPEQTVDEDADAVWRNAGQRAAEPPRQSGLMGEYMNALKEQMRNGKPR
ncbi:Hypothetical protein R9X50_00703800 [Acrodontium crateriforme]|uniref:Uncharacterized protein n=1 Tax=Acrodontium crateriforme TaxID=150365 RepID=A0AAQ3M902_9PEZI|nr:Hypothetical protein R9X50_00703800 [Acrodontium crateriforme]